MPFVKEKYHIEEETIAFLYVMRTLNFTQGQAQRHIAKGRLLIDGKSMTYTGAKVQGDVEMVFFRAKGRGRRPLFHNKDFMVFEKPSGTLVHPNTMSTPYSMLDEVRTVAGANANSTHRIDMETSGLLLASKHKKAERHLKGSFENRTIKKSYLAWVDGKLTEPFSSTECIKINKEGYETTKHKVFIDDEGKASHTDFIPLEYDENLNLTGGLVFSQRVLLELPIAGVSREDAYRIVQRNAMKVWEEIQQGKSTTNDEGESLYLQYLLADDELRESLSEEQIRECFNFDYYTKNVDKIFARVFK